MRRWSKAGNKNKAEIRWIRKNWFVVGNCLASEIGWRETSNAEKFNFLFSMFFCLFIKELNSQETFTTF